jgi:hypothetical protein
MASSFNGRTAVFEAAYVGSIPTLAASDEVYGMATVAACTKCHGLGEIVFTKQDGGPVCPHCGGRGWLTPDLLAIYLASVLDHPSVYMGGPSQANLRRAKRIVEFLQQEGIIPNDRDIGADQG